MTDKKLWEIFSVFIRLRDSDENGYCQCITCPRVEFFKYVDCGHGVGRQHKGVKYNEKNNHAQCKSCNGFEEGRKDRYKEEVNKRYGPNTWDLLHLAAKQASRLGSFEMLVLAKVFAANALQLARARGLNLKELYPKINFTNPK